MSNLSFADITYEQGLMLLCARKQALDSGQLPRMTARVVVAATQEKRSFDFGKAWGNLSDATKNVILSGAGGTVAGAGIGLGSASLHGEGDYLRRMLRGGLAGGAVGSGVGLAFNPDVAVDGYNKLKSYLPSFKQPPKSEDTPDGFQQLTQDAYNKLSPDEQLAHQVEAVRAARKHPVALTESLTGRAAVAGAVLPYLPWLRTGDSRLKLTETMDSLYRHINDPKMPITEKQLGAIFRPKLTGDHVSGQSNQTEWGKIVMQEVRDGKMTVEQLRKVLAGADPLVAAPPPLPGKPTQPGWFSKLLTAGNPARIYQEAIPHYWNEFSPYGAGANLDKQLKKVLAPKLYDEVKVKGWQRPGGLGRTAQIAGVLAGIHGIYGTWGNSGNSAEAQKYLDTTEGWNQQLKGKK